MSLFGPDNLEFKPNAETIICLCICFVVALVFVIGGILARKQDPTKPSKGLLFLLEWAVEKVDNFTATSMGEGFPNFGGVVLPIICFLFLNFVIGISGLPTPMAYLPIPLALGLFTFLMIHITSIRYTKWSYFKRYLDPIPIFLPTTLLSMWSPLLSLSLRLFGNAISGYVLLTLTNWGLKNAATALTGLTGGPEAMVLIPIATPLLHAYFDVFSSFIQTLVFISLSCLFIAQERPEQDMQLAVGSRKEP